MSISLLFPIFYRYSLYIPIIQHIQHIQHRKLLTMLFDKVNVRTPAAKSGWLWFCGSQLDSLDMTLELRWQERDSEPLSDVDSSEDSWWLIDFWQISERFYSPTMPDHTFWISHFESRKSPSPDFEPEQKPVALREACCICNSIDVKFRSELIRKIDARRTSCKSARHSPYWRPGWI